MVNCGLEFLAWKSGRIGDIWNEINELPHR